jgi:hypothetical protein
MGFISFCKRPTLYELSSKPVMLLSPIAESRRLWAILQKHFTTGALVWKIAEQSSILSGQALRKCYWVQLIDAEAESGVQNFIHCEMNLANL